MGVPPSGVSRAHPLSVRDCVYGRAFSLCPLLAVSHSHSALVQFEERSIPAFLGLISDGVVFCTRF